MDKKVTRRIIKLSVSGEGKNALTRVAQQYGMKEYVVAGRIYEWFLRQDDIYQRAVLGLLEGLEMDAAKRFMERLAGDDPRPLKAGRSIGREGSARRALPKPRKLPPQSHVPDDGPEGEKPAK